MKYYDLRPLIAEMTEVIEAHRLPEPGTYAKQTMADPKTGKLPDPNPLYGTAIAANLLYTLHALPEKKAEREDFVRALQEFQDPESGMFRCPGMYETHTTAFASGALDVLGEKPLYPAKALEPYLTKDGICGFMDAIDWAGQPWIGAHLGSGIYGSMILTGEAGDDWEDLYFGWLDANEDPETGLWKAGSLAGAPAFHYLAATFHYVFNYEYAKREIPCAEALLDTCIRAYRNGDCPDFRAEIGWPDIDFAYMLVRLSRRTGTRKAETTEILEEIAEGLFDQLLAREIRTDAELDNLNTMFAAASAIAVLQDALPGKIRTSKPLRLVLDRRPFI